ncbi:hypothetical protein [Maridesulfovibrio zosterae]|uniref:hypothetical protein n=1 Tax=Maridesulfovibrio zosterae TaxID=82171 RepID=UPI0003FBC9E3|nr:hypothetical protein [Maridesulfovibrio zosterae]
MNISFGIETNTEQAFKLAGNKNVENSVDENKTPSVTSDIDGDTVEISAEAKEKLEQSKTQYKKQKAPDDVAGSGSGSNDDETIKTIQERIEKLQEEIKKLKENPETNKKMISAKENELVQLQGQLLQMIKENGDKSGSNVSGGTSAQGFTNSLT